MVKEAEASAADDAKKREEIDARNKAEAEAYQAEQAAKAAQAATGCAETGKRRQGRRGHRRGVCRNTVVPRAWGSGVLEPPRGKL